jgi:8-oxo-dGTP pyrophosphatase MutT (NUDIX family)
MASEPESWPPRLLVAAGLVWHPSGILAQRRAEGSGHGAGRLELPGGKIERGESPRAALARELFEEWGPAAAGLTLGGVVDVVHHVYRPPGPEVVLVVLHVDARPLGDGWAAALRPAAGVTIELFAPSALPTDAFLEADRPLLESVRQGRLVAPWETRPV